MANVLAATLGEAPAVVSGMIRALAEHSDGPRIVVDRVLLLYPAEEVDRYIWRGKELLAEALEGRCTIQEFPLPLADADSEERTVEYLRCLAEALNTTGSNDTVYLSLAGGRKHTSALTAVIAQFYPQVQGLYHLLDAADPAALGSAFVDIEDLERLPRHRRDEVLWPPVERLRLMSVPWFSQPDRGVRLRRYLSGPQPQEAPQALSDEAEAFFRDVFGPRRQRRWADVWLSEAAVDDYEALSTNGQGQVKSIARTLRESDLAVLDIRHRLRGFETDCVCFPEQHSHKDLRVFCSHTGERQLTIHRIFPHGVYERFLKRPGRLWAQDYPPVKRLADLAAGTGVLVAPLGDSPMVVTQTIALLREREEKTAITEVALVYPGGSGAIDDSAYELQDLLQNSRLAAARGSDPIKVNVCPVEGLSDVDSGDACERFGRGLMGAIEAARERHPDTRLFLSLSGGRKSMAALAYYAAQRTGVPEVWHTVIRDPALERRIEREADFCSSAWRTLSKEDKVRRLFLHSYREAIDQFALFSIPVIV